MSISIRPQTLAEFKGKEDIKHNLKIYIDSSIANNRPLDHCLIYGLPGTGKTTLASIIANEMGCNIRILQGGSLNKNIDIINLLLSINENDIIFIDEIHAINPTIIDMLFTAIEDFVLDIPLGKDFNTKFTRIKLPRFTLIGATTKFGRIPLPLEERFGIVINLKTYDLESLCEIIAQAANKMGIKLKPNEIEAIADNSKNIPRNAIKILKRVNDFKMYDESISIEKIFEHMKIGTNGLTQDDFEYLQTLKEHDEPLGLKTISDMINVDVDTIQNKIEPYLISNSYIIKTFRGRQITEKGMNAI
jgi:Holliday junction DNA helicase RuvB